MEQGQNTTSQAPSSAPYLKRWVRYFRYKYPIKFSEN